MKDEDFIDKVLGIVRKQSKELAEDYKVILSERTLLDFLNILAIFMTAESLHIQEKLKKKHVNEKDLNFQVANLIDQAIKHAKSEKRLNLRSGDIISALINQKWFPLCESD